MDDRAHLEQLLQIRQNYLRYLEQQEAGFGMHAPAHIKLDIDNTRAEIASLEARLAQLAGQGRSLVPDNLLPTAPIFVGRKQEIGRCLEALSPDERGWGVVIDGIGGMGKTTLALEVAHQARKAAQFDAYLYASAKTTWLTGEGVRQETLALSSLDAFVREFARLIGGADLAAIPDATERRRALLDALRGRRALLIWDNLETLDDEEHGLIAEFLRRLPGENKAIVTSRRRVGESAVTIRLDRLSVSEAYDLMDAFGRRHARVSAELALASTTTKHAIYEAVGGNPLALHFTLGLVAQKGYTLDTALARLRDPARASDLYGFLFADAVRDLQATDSAVLSALAAFHTPVGVAALAEATRQSAVAVALAVEQLVTLSLVNDLAGGSYGLHPLTRIYVRAVLGQGEDAQRPALSGLELDQTAHRNALHFWVEYAQKYGGNREDAYQTFDRLEAEWPNLEAVAADLRDLAGIPGPLADREAARMLIDISHTLSSFLQLRGLWSERVRQAEWAYEAAKALDDWSAAGWRASDIAWIHYYRAETDRLAVWSDRMTEAMERGGGHRERAYATRMRGLLAERRGDLAEAERLWNDALTTFRDLDDEAAQSTVLGELGSIARQREEYDRAEAFYQQSLALLGKNGYKPRLAVRLISLGYLDLDRDRYAEARAWFERGLPLAREIDRHDLLANVQHGLALVLQQEGRYKEALVLAAEALRIRERLRDRRQEMTRRLVLHLDEQAQADS
jgi:tetratricopeptide (TPR) repeat protein